MVQTLKKHMKNYSLEGVVQDSLHFFRQNHIAPFTATDTSVGMEHELQVAVEGDQKDVDLPIIITRSRYFKNTVKRAERGDLSKDVVRGLNHFLENNEERIWENSWVYFPEQCLAPRTRAVIARDLLADKSKPDGKKRTDSQIFYTTRKGQNCLRVPISYLLKLSLLDAVYQTNSQLPFVHTAEKLANHFISDNTSPEILSFNLVQGAGNQTGVEAAKEGARVFLLTQMLGQYANKQFRLQENGQRAIVYNAPHAPRRQKILNELVPEGFYRHLFMSPCLSGWDKGEDKHHYMALCHRALSTSQLNTITKLKDAGILKNNLTILPNTSNTCLANNGTHISLGSSILSKLGAEQNPHFSEEVEKYLADLVIKIVEHFLPLLVNTYSAAPYRLDFHDCHPEKVLGFLPHELDYTHLRMIWRRWKKKADLSFMGKDFSPFGPRKFDQLLAKIFRLKGDFIPDYRLIDYLVALRSTETSRALDGRLGNQARLKEELAEMGIFDPQMSIYLPYRMRSYTTMGYSGFEGRSYSLFQSFLTDMAEAVSLQNLITAFAYSHIIDGRIRHQDIPDTPSVESERRQVFFATALGVPTFYVRANSGNRFMKKILSKVKRQRNSRRYKGYIRIEVQEYKRALVSLLEEDNRELIEQLGMNNCISSLKERLAGTGQATLEKIAIESNKITGCTSPMKCSSDKFNQATETYYRNGLKRSQTEEGLAILLEDCRLLEQENNHFLRQIAQSIKLSCSEFIEQQKENLLTETCDIHSLETFIHIMLVIIRSKQTSQQL